MPQRLQCSYAGAARSVFQWHDETFMIWTDMLPLLVFVVLWVVNVASPLFADRDPFYKTLVCGVYAAVVISRLCSLLYHVFKCVSQRAQCVLLNIDLTGISCMALGSPWLFAVANRVNTPAESSFICFCASILILFLACHVAGASGQLILLAAVGNYPSVVIALDPTFVVVWRVHASAALATIVIGYALFYSGRWPERNMPPGAADAKIWNSHVLWHMSASVSQLAYVSMTFL
jgi:predicted membrane channel-forming protein YqfA (hemolysin III family)